MKCIELEGVTVGCVKFTFHAGSVSLPHTLFGLILHAALMATSRFLFLFVVRLGFFTGGAAVLLVVLLSPYTYVQTHTQIRGTSSVVNPVLV